MTEETRDVVIVGAGPAGLAAARAVASRGLRVRLIDEQAAAGGQIWRNAALVAGEDNALAKSYGGAAEALTVLQDDHVDAAQGATVLDVAFLPDADGIEGVKVTWLSAGTDTRRVHETDARALIVATGALERPLLFPGATLPGVMGVGAVQGILKQSGMVPGGDGIVLAGQGPLLLLTMAQILAHGGAVSAVLDIGQRSARAKAAPGALSALISDPAIMAQGASLLWQARRSGVPWYRDITSLCATGTNGIEEVTFCAGGKAVRLPCNLLAVHDGVIPNTQITRLLALEHVWSDAQQSFAARTTAEGRTSAPSVWVAGDGAGIAGVGVARLRGALAGLDVARALGAVDDVSFEPKAAALRGRIAGRARARAFVDRLYAPRPVDAFVGSEDAGDTILCRCEAVTLARIHDAVRDGATGPNRVKTFTRCGMGACQGRICGNLLTRVVAMRTQTMPQDAGALRIRPPLKPTLISDYLETPSDRAPAP